MTRILLIRHGKTDWNQQLRIQGGSSDIPLNSEGRRQAQNIALRLGQRSIRAIFSSPLKRALETAESIAQIHNIKVVVEKSLREVEAGDLEGVTSAELGKRFSELLTQDGVSRRIPGGESLTDLQQRGWGFIRQLGCKHINSELIVVSHYFAILTIICSALVLPLTHITRFRLSTGSISIINIDEEESRLELFNDTGRVVQFP